MGRGRFRGELHLAAREVEVDRSPRGVAEPEHVREGGRVIAALPDEVLGRLHHPALGVRPRSNACPFHRRIADMYAGIHISKNGGPTLSWIASSPSERRQQFG